VKKYKLQITIIVDLEARNREQAYTVAQDMDVKFIHPDTGKELAQSLVDWEIIEQ
jgi:hypothetical protein